MYKKGQERTDKGKKLYFKKLDAHRINVAEHEAQSVYHDGGSFQVVMRFKSDPEKIHGYTGRISMDTAERFQNKYGGEIQQFDDRMIYLHRIYMAFGGDNITEYAPYYLSCDNRREMIDENPYDDGITPKRFWDLRETI